MKHEAPRAAAAATGGFSSRIRCIEGLNGEGGIRTRGTDKP